MDARAFHMLFNQLVVKIKEANQVQEDPWLNTEEAMQLLKISSRTFAFGFPVGDVDIFIKIFVGSHEP